MKILNSDFRKELYKQLIDAGYDKMEAQKIVGVKYFNALKEELKNTLTNIINDIENDNFQILNEGFDLSFNDKISELKKMKEYLN